MRIPQNFYTKPHSAAAAKALADKNAKEEAERREAERQEVAQVENLMREKLWNCDNYSYYNR